MFWIPFTREIFILLTVIGVVALILKKAAGETKYLWLFIIFTLLDEALGFYLRWAVPRMDVVVAMQFYHDFILLFNLLILFQFLAFLFYGYSLIIRNIPELTVSGVMFGFAGRVRRSEYWFFNIVMASIFYHAYFISFSNHDNRLDVFHFINVTDIVLISTYVLMTCYISLAVRTKRWHDRGKSGWMIFVNVIPVIGPVWEIVELGFLEGSADENKYGKPVESQAQSA